MVGARQTMKKTKHVEKYDEDKVKALKKLKKHQNLLSSMSSVSHDTRQDIFDSGNVPNPKQYNVSCPKCECGMSDDEVNDGFLLEEYDFTTKCPNCSKRFICTSNFGGDYVVWLCESQTKAVFTDWLEENDHIFSELVKRPEILYNIHRYATKEKITAKDWIKKYFPDIHMEDKKTLKLYSVAGEYVISAYSTKDIKENKEDIKLIGFAEPDVKPNTIF